MAKRRCAHSPNSSEWPTNYGYAKPEDVRCTDEAEPRSQFCKAHGVQEDPTDEVNSRDYDRWVSQWTTI